MIRRPVGELYPSSGSHIDVDVPVSRRICLLDLPFLALCLAFAVVELLVLFFCSHPTWRKQDVQPSVAGCRSRDDLRRLQGG